MSDREPIPSGVFDDVAGVVGMLSADLDAPRADVDVALVQEMRLRIDSTGTCSTASPAAMYLTGLDVVPFSARVGDARIQVAWGPRLVEPTLHLAVLTVQFTADGMVAELRHRSVGSATGDDGDFLGADPVSWFSAAGDTDFAGFAINSIIAVLGGSGDDVAALVRRVDRLNDAVISA
ncbi:hypothetical protein [Corynebacterium sp. AOP12-C2-36]|uniref:hypothetical protein n=1 Tax=Corynebacterium sp. AOP12-C2-36 TaxID=3457723 RepID=UPI0040345509